MPSFIRINRRHPTHLTCSCTQLTAKGQLSPVHRPRTSHQSLLHSSLSPLLSSRLLYTLFTRDDSMCISSRLNNTPSHSTTLSRRILRHCLHFDSLCLASSFTLFSLHLTHTIHSRFIKLTLFASSTRHSSSPSSSCSLLNELHNSLASR